MARLSYMGYPAQLLLALRGIQLFSACSLAFFGLHFDSSDALDELILLASLPPSNYYTSICCCYRYGFILHSVLGVIHRLWGLLNCSLDVKLCEFYNININLLSHSRSGIVAKYGCVLLFSLYMTDS